VLCTFIVIWFNSVQYYVKYIHKYEWRIALLWCCVGRYFNLLWINDVLYSCDVVLVDILIWYEWMTYCTPVMLCLSIFWSAMSEWRSALLWCCVCQYVDLLWVNDIVHSCDVVLKIIEIIFVEIPFPNANSCSEIRNLFLICASPICAFVVLTSGALLCFNVSCIMLPLYDYKK
jgi:hypothetical protein